MGRSINSYKGHHLLRKRASLRGVNKTLAHMSRPTALGRIFLSALLVLVLAGAQAQYNTGDYGSWATGNWNTLGTWRIYDGVSWASSPGAGAVPNATHTVYIRGGTTVTAVFGSTYSVANLIVEAGGKLFNNNTGPTNLSYVGIHGNTFTCDGVIGNGATLDGISFNIEGSNVVLSGAGTFDAARMRKNANINPVTSAALTLTNFTIAMNVNLRFSGGTNTMIYNNFTGTTTFNVIIGAGSTVTLIGAAGAGNLAMDGVNGTGIASQRGSYTVNGTLIVPGTIYMVTNNPAGNGCTFTVNNGGYVRTAQLDTGPTGSGAGTHLLTLNAGSTMEITGTPVAWVNYIVTNNFFSLNSASRVIYSGAGPQDVRNISGGYGHLRLLGAGLKTLGGLTSVRGDLDILNTTGSPVLDVSGSNFGMSVSGNWTNYAQSGFNEGSGITAYVNFNGTAAAQSVNTPGGEQFNIWRFSKTIGQPLVTMNCNVQVASTLELNTGIIDLNGNELRLMNPLASAITTSVSFSTLRHIKSERTDNTSRVRWEIGSTTGAHLVPFGTTAAYTPFTFNLVSGDAGSVTMATYGTPQNNLPWPVTPIAVTNLNSIYGLPNEDATVDRFWEVDVTGTSPAPVAGLTFTYAASELPIAPFNDPLSMRAQRWNSGGSLWEPQLEGNSAAYTATTDLVVAAFGPFVLTPLTSPLPVELLSFDAKPVGSAVQLDWTTASERNNDYFTILRSSDGTTFEELFTMEGAGVSNVPLYYTGVDRDPLMGTSYYKLRQTDTDGSTSESEVEVVHFGTSTILAAYPNPAEEVLNIVGLTGTVGTLRITDALGRTVLELGSTEGSRVVLDVSALPAGPYLLTVVGVEAPRSLPFVKR